MPATPASPPFAFDVTPADAVLYSRMIGAFVPPDTFDVHVHLYRVEQQGEGVIPFVAAGPPVIDFESFRDLPHTWMGDAAPREGLFFALPRPGMDVAGSNDFIEQQTDRGDASRWLLLIHPDDDPADVEQRIATSPTCVGFKVYHVFAAGLDQTFDAALPQFLPEWSWEIADRLGLSIMLHIVKPRALADETNQRYIREHCVRYPGAKLILAHAARGFNGRHTVEGIGALRGLDNVWFDTSCVCESEPIEAILNTFGPTRLMFGSDFPFTEIHGRNLALGDRFFWLFKDNADYAAQASLDAPTLIGIESLLAVKQACRNFGVNDADVQRIFRDNARQLLGITQRPQAVGPRLYERAKQIIPGATQLFGKRSEHYAPGQWPAYFAEARGCETIDLSGNHYIDFSMNGIGACLLGFADPDVTAAVQRRVKLGGMCTLNPPEEVELAEMLLDIHPWARMVRFGRAGGEQMAMAIRIARARTRRDHVVFCGYHGWHDWYLAANLGDENNLGGEHLMDGLPAVGVPQGLAGTMHPFNYNDIDSLKRIVSEHGNDLAAICLEPTRSGPPEAGFLESVRELADACGAVLVMDEISIGWRLCFGGAHLKFGIEPDIAVYAKTLGNGHPIAAVVGRDDVMAAAQDTFISSAFWTEAVGPAAAVATLRKMQRVDVVSHAARIGEQTRDGLNQLAAKHGVPLRIAGWAAFNEFSFDHDAAAALQTLWTVRMLERGYLCSNRFYPTLAHEPRHVDAFLAATDAAFADMAKGLAAGDLESRIGGPVKTGGFYRLN